MLFIITQSLEILQRSGIVLQSKRNLTSEAFFLQIQNYKYNCSGSQSFSHSYSNLHVSLSIILLISVAENTPFQLKQFSLDIHHRFVVLCSYDTSKTIVMNKFLRKLN